MASGQVALLEKPRKRGIASPAAAPTYPRAHPSIILPRWVTLVWPSTSGGTRSSRSKRADIAIVEDEGDLLSIYSAFFLKLGFEAIRSFDNGEDLLRAVSRGETLPELVIMDYRLPGKDGLDTAERVVELNPRAKVVITTADDSIRARATSMGFVFLQKPFALSDLLRTVNDP
jgi:CheY-like chemotaxis protein